MFDTDLKYIGYYLPLGEIDSFANPLFGVSKYSNMLYEQIISPDGRVLGFQEFDVESEIIRASDDFSISIGDHALFVFYCSARDSIHINTADLLALDLIELLPEYDDLPAVYASIADFVGDYDEYSSANQRHYERLEAHYNKTSADVWFDSQIRLPYLKQAIDEQRLRFKGNVSSRDILAIVSSGERAEVHLIAAAFDSLSDHGAKEVAVAGIHMAAILQAGGIGVKACDLCRVETQHGLRPSVYALGERVGPREFDEVCWQVSHGSAAYLESAGEHVIDCSTVKFIEPTVAVQFAGLAKWIEQRGGKLTLRFGTNSSTSAIRSLRRLIDLSWPNAFQDLTGKPIEEFLDVAAPLEIPRSRIPGSETINDTLSRIILKQFKTKDRFRVLKYMEPEERSTQYPVPQEIFLGVSSNLPNMGYAANVFDCGKIDDMEIHDSTSILSRVLQINFFKLAVLHKGARQFNFLGNISQVSKIGKVDGRLKFGCWCDASDLLTPGGFASGSPHELFAASKNGMLEARATLGIALPSYKVEVLRTRSPAPIGDLKNLVKTLFTYDRSYFKLGINLANIMNFFLICVQGRLWLRSGRYIFECESKKNLNWSVGRKKYQRIVDLNIKLKEIDDDKGFSGSHIDIACDFVTSDILKHSNAPPAPSSLSSLSSSDDVAADSFDLIIKSVDRSN